MLLTCIALFAGTINLAPKQLPFEYTVNKIVNNEYREYKYHINKDFDGHDNYVVIENDKGYRFTETLKCKVMK